VLRMLYRAASWLVLLPLLGVVVLIVTLHWTLHPTRSTIRMTPKAYGLNEEDVTFVTEDGYELRGWFVSALSAEDIGDDELKSIRQKRPTIVLCHDLNGARDQMLPMARIFHEAGYNCLLFDFRGHGESGGEYTSFGLHERRDLRAAVSYVRLRAAEIPWIDPQRVAVYGVGMGATVALTVAAEDPYIRGVIADTPFQSLDSEFRREAAARLPASGFFAAVYELGFNCWFQGNAGSVDAVEAARHLRGRPVMVVSPPAGKVRAAEARAVFDAAGGATSVLAFASGDSGPRWMDDPTPIEPALKGFLVRVAGTKDAAEPAPQDPAAVQPALSPQPHPTEG
jgi:alpha/beta superfamily hydrolase